MLHKWSTFREGVEMTSLTIKRYLVDLAGFLISSGCPSDMCVPVLQDSQGERRVSVVEIERLWLLPDGAWLSLEGLGHGGIRSSIWVSESASLVIISRVGVTALASWFSVTDDGNTSLMNAEARSSYWSPVVFGDISEQLFGALSPYLQKLRQRAEAHLKLNTPSQ